MCIQVLEGNEPLWNALEALQPDKIHQQNLFLGL